jgi:RNA-directed DNA polymerase
MASVTEFLEKRLKLQVNRQKSAGGHVRERKFLGYRLLEGGALGVAPQSQEKLKGDLRELTRRNGGQSLEPVSGAVNEKLTGWVQYFHLARRKSVLEDLSQWLRRRGRSLKLKPCRRTCAIARFLMKAGESERSAWLLALSGKGWWRLADTPQAHRAMSLSWFKENGLIDPAAVYLALQNACRSESPGAEQARRVV